MRGSRAIVMFLLCLTLPASGCGSSGLEFQPREDVEELIPPAQEYMQSLMTGHFGTPTEPVAWEKLPVRYHAAVATVSSAPDGSALVVDVSDQLLPIEQGQEVLWLAGGEDRRGWVQSYDDQTHSLILTGSDEPDSPWTGPREGDVLTIGAGETLKQGRMLYAQHCQHCHGVSGDGNGPTAEYLNPRPRDYRLGKFKFTSTTTVRRPRRQDLSRIVEEGIPGTYMPSFKLLAEDESLAIVEYVLWLSMRGEAELRRVQILKLDFLQADAQEAIADGDDPNELLRDFAEALESDFPLDFADETQQIADAWRVSQEDDSVVTPKIPRTSSSPESIAKGRELFLGKTAKCVTCHGESGKGDGPQTLLVAKGPDGRDLPVPGLFSDWGDRVEPRDLTTGIYRGGRRPIDIYRRIHSGVKGTPMTGFGTSLSDEQIWDLVNYVMSIPFEQRETGRGPFVPAESPEVESVAATE